MTDRPLLSIVTITYNNAQGLQRTLESLTVQQAILPGSVEWVVVDGASTDDTVAVAELAPPSTVYICEPDQGVYDAMNKGWKRSSGHYVQFLNAGDCFSGSHSLAALLGELQSRQCLWLVARATTLCGGKGKSILIGNMPHVWWRHAVGLQPHCHQSTVFARSLLEILGGYCLDFDFVGDFDLILRCGLISAPAEVTTTIVAYEGGGMSSTRQDEIPLLLHQVRSYRLQLSGLALRMDKLWALLRRTRLRLARTVAGSSSLSRVRGLHRWSRGGRPASPDRP